jgi:urease accessory protein
VTQGNAFLATMRAAWPADVPHSVLDVLAGDIAYPVAVGAGTG